MLLFYRMILTPARLVALRVKMIHDTNVLRITLPTFAFPTDQKIVHEVESTHRRYRLP